MWSPTRTAISRRAGTSSRKSLSAPQCKRLPPGNPPASPHRPHLRTALSRHCMKIQAVQSSETHSHGVMPFISKGTSPPKVLTAVTKLIGLVHLEPSFRLETLSRERSIRLHPFSFLQVQVVFGRSGYMRRVPTARAVVRLSRDTRVRRPQPQSSMSREQSSSVQFPVAAWAAIIMSSKINLPLCRTTIPAPRGSLMPGLATIGGFSCGSIWLVPEYQAWLIAQRCGCFYSRQEIISHERIAPILLLRHGCKVRLPGTFSLPLTELQPIRKQRL